MDCIFLRICYIVEETIPQPSPPLLDPMRKEGNVCQHCPAWVVRQSPGSKANQGESRRWGRCSISFSRPPEQSLLTSHPSLNLKSFTVITFVEDWPGATQRICCIYSIPQKLTVVDRESAPQHNPRIGKNDAWCWKLPHQMTRHKLIWWLEGQSWLADFP